LSPTEDVTGGFTRLPAGDAATSLGTFLGTAAGPSFEAVASGTAGEDGETRLPSSGRTPPPKGAAGPLAAGQSFGSRYHIIRLLGAGGMGAVYHAWDAELGVAVALKVIKPQVMADPHVAAEVSRRFKRELLLARQVTHKNVVRIHDLGEIDGIKYITMSYVEGSDLATILRRDGALPVARALAIARAVVAGLQAAHDAGVVHRDLKPENIMVEKDGHALIMDFGIARSTAHAPEVAPGSVSPAMRRQAQELSAGHTMAGTVVGTLEYMAPEQARGEAVDQRADIYAFGLILYDMLVGKKQRVADSSDAMNELMARMHAAPAPARMVNHDVPAPLDAIINRCIQPDAAARFQTTTELAQILEQLDERGERLPFARRVTRAQLAAAAVAVVALLAGTWQLTRWLTPVPEEARPAVSVLIADFENTTNDPVFDGALEQALNLAMEDATFINSYSRNQAMTVAGQIKPGTSRLDEAMARLVVQREPDIKYVLAGRIEPDSGGYRLAVRVVDPIPGTVIAEESRSADGKADVLPALGSVAAGIREALGDAKSETARLTANESFTAASLEAARDYSEAQRLANSGRDEDALALYDRAIKQDPNLGRAYASMALSASKLGRTPEAEALWKQALARIDRMTERERYRTLGTYYMDVLGSDEQGLEQYKNLVQKFPADGAAHNNLANAYFRLLDFASARQEGRTLLDIYPKSVLYNYNYALFSMYAGDFDEADRAAQAAIELNPSAPPYKAFFARAVAALSRGDVAAAEKAYVDGRGAGARGVSLAAVGLADLAMYQGRYADAEPLLKTGIDADLAAKNTAGAASKYAALAEAYSAQHKAALAVSAAESALKLSQSESIVVPTARVYVAAGREKDARALADKLDARLRPRSRAYGKLIAGEIALRRGQVTEAVDAFRASQQFADNTTIVKGATKGYWLARLDLGIAYVLAGTEQSAAAFAEFETCLKRQGEAGSVFLDDVPTYRHIVPLWYWMARAQEGLNLKADAVSNYKKYLALRPAASGDPLAADAQKRLAGK
jgi:tetratricopeptide (TPR) repeat protein/tRNA A-37 threonylcarbamoyl transferase component Bud32